MKRLSIVTALLAATTLAACSGGSDAPPPPPNETENSVVVEELPAEPVNIAEPAPIATSTPAPEVVVSNTTVEAQVQDDADAVGMTARLPRTENQETPQQPVE